MNFIRLPAPTRLCLGLILIFLAGCSSSSQPIAAIGVSSPPPPSVGSAPIAAYDDYARAVARPDKGRIDVVALADTR